MKKIIKCFILFLFYGIESFVFAQNTSIDPNFVQVPKLSVVPTCAVTDKGKLYFNTNDNKMFFCNGSAWVDFSVGAFTLPYSGNGNTSGNLVSLTNAGTGNTLKTTGKLQYVGIGEGVGKVLTSDANGNATWQGVSVAFMAYFTNNGNANSGAEGAISAMTEVFDEGGNFQTGTFTAPQDGIYHFDAAVKWGTNNSASNFSQATIEKCNSGGTNCVIMASSKLNNQIAAQHSFGVNIKLVAAETVKVFVLHTNSDNIPRVIEGQDGNGNRPTYFSGYLIR